MTFRLFDVLSASSVQASGRSAPCPKHSHKSEGAARAHLRAEQRAGRIAAIASMDAYRCSRCGEWHIGKKRPATPQGES